MLNIKKGLKKYNLTDPGKQYDKLHSPKPFSLPSVMLNLILRFLVDLKKGIFFKTFLPIIKYFFLYNYNFKFCMDSLRSNYIAN